MSTKLNYTVKSVLIYLLKNRMDLIKGYPFESCLFALLH